MAGEYTTPEIDFDYFSISYSGSAESNNDVPSPGFGWEEEEEGL